MLVLASFAPKFNARYVMLALPGLLLIWAAGLAKGLEIGDWRLEIRWLHSISNLQSPVSFLSLIFIMASFSLC